MISGTRLVRALVATLLSPLAAHAATYNWGPSGLVGAGTQNALAIQPGGTGLIVSAADISGFQRTTNYGASWRTTNTGTPIGGAPRVAAVVFSNNPATPNTVYAGIGNMGADGGFLASTDGGQTWDVRSTVPQFSGNGESSYPGLPHRWPRSTGNLIAVDEVGATKYIYAGTFKDGVMRSTDGGNTWATVGLAGKHIRSIAINPTAPWKIFATDYADHVWFCNAARGTTGTGTAGWTQRSAAPDTIEELFFVGNNLYAAGKNGATGGVWRSNDDGVSWPKLGGTTVPTTSTYTAITGYNNGTNDVLFLGATDPAQDTADGNYKTILRSTNSGSTWTAITLSANINTTIGGPGGPQWWMSLPGGGPYILGRAACDVAYLALDLVDRNKLFFGGRGGIWGTTNALAATAANVEWYPMIEGLTVTVGCTVTTDPNNPGRVYVGNEDWIFFYSTDFGATFRRNASGMTLGNTSRTIYVDPTNSRVYCGTLDHAGVGGDLYSNPDPTTGQAWVSEGLAAAAASKEPRGVAAIHNGGTRILLAVLEGGGLWRKVGTGAWSQVSTAITASGAVTINFVWWQGTSNVFVYIKGSGLWRSINYGQSWTNIWNTTTSATGTGALAGNPVNLGELYVSTDSGVFRFLGAQSGTPTPTYMGGPADPGPLAYSNGALYAADIVNTTHTGRMYKWNNPGTSLTPALISDGTNYPGHAGWPTGVAIDSSGIVHVSNRGNSVLSGETAELLTDYFEDGTSDGWATDTGTWSVVTDGTKMFKVVTGTNAAGVAHRGSLTWSNYSVQADVKPLSLGAGAIGLSARYTDYDNRYFVVANGAGQLQLKKSIAGVQTTLASVAFTAANNTTYTFKLTANGNALTVHVNGVLKLSATDASFSSGRVALNAYNATGEFDAVVVTDLN